MYAKYVFFAPEGLQMTGTDFLGGLEFSLPFLLVLTVHEFGHFFTARYHRIAVTLPYYIPMWLGFIGGPSIGTMGAFIRIKQRIFSLRQYFDVGIAGPLAGFVVAVVLLAYGFTHLPDPEYIFQIHPEYSQYGLDYANHVYTDNSGVSFKFGGNLLFWFFETYVADPVRMPNPHEIMHYPLLLAGYLSLFFTALNLLPIGQLDGGHVLFGMMGPRWHAIVSRVLFTGFVFYAGIGVVTIDAMADTSPEGIFQFLLSMVLYLYFLQLCAHSVFPEKRNRWLFAASIMTGQFLIHFFFQTEGYMGWLLFGLLLGRFIGVDHPPVVDYQPLTLGRKLLGWLALIIFILCFSPQPFILE